MPQDKITRNDLLTAVLGKRTVSEVEIKEITLNPGQKAPLHTHPCPVVGYIFAGEAAVQIKGEPLQVISAGGAFFETANTVIEHFDNASNTEPMTFVAFYLLDGEQELINMIE